MRRAAEAIVELGRAWRHRVSVRRAMAELAACPARELHRTAADLGLSTTDLRQLSRTRPGRMQLMPQRLQQLGLDPEFVRNAEPETYRDLARVCATCTAWRRCKRDLARDDVQAGMEAYCLNSATIDRLTVEPQGRN
jgi:hypothetical protein